MLKPYFDNGKGVTLFHGDTLEILPELLATYAPDCVLTDPPYVGQVKASWDKTDPMLALVSRFAELLSENTLITFFGFGVPQFTWSIKLEKAGFPFKEQIVWNKRFSGSPLNIPQRMHETIHIHGKRAFNKKVRIPFEKDLSMDFQKLFDTFRRASSSLKNPKVTEALEKLLTTGEQTYDRLCRESDSITTPKKKMDRDRGLASLVSIVNGRVPQSIILAPAVHYGKAHPCEKPVGVMEYLVTLCSERCDLVIDPFMGAGSTGVACLKTGREFIGIEAEERYCEITAKRLEKTEAEPEMEGEQND